MNQIKISEITILFLIALIGLGGGGFLWHYTTVVQTQTDENHIANTLRQPKVLGATWKEPNIFEEPLIVDSTNETRELPLQSDVMVPTEINKLFLILCMRDATLQELDQWVNYPSQSLEIHLKKDNNCR